MSLSKVKSLHSIPSERVKCLDFHPTQPLLLAALYSGDGLIIDCNSGAIIKNLNVHHGVPLRTCKWVPTNGNVVFGGDKSSICFFSPTKGQLLLEVPNAHDAFIRSLQPHPTEPLMLSCSDDYTIKLWDISDGCKLLKTFKAHKSLVMDAKWCPHEQTSFASCSLEGKIIFWDTSSSQPKFSQSISKKCINSISFSTTGDRSLLAAGTDDMNIQIWDYQARSLVATLEGHEHNVTRVEFHPTRPILISTSEDNVSYLWSTTTFKKENSLTSRLDRGWAVSFSSSFPFLSIGYDKGLNIYKFVNSGIPMSLDRFGKLVIGHGNVLSTSIIKNVNDIVDGSEINMTIKDEVTIESPPIDILHSPNGNYVSIVTDDEWSIRGTIVLSSIREFGKGLKFAWCYDSKRFAVLNIHGSITFWNNFKTPGETIPIFASRIWGGELLSVINNEGTEFYDWDSKYVGRIEAKAKDIKWNNDLLALQLKESIFILQYNRDNEAENEKFEILHEITCKSSSICWVLDELFYTENNKINRFISGIVIPTSTLKVTPTIIGYITKENLLVLADQNRNIIGINIPYSLIQFESDISNYDNEEEDENIEMLNIPEKYIDRCSKFLKQIGKLNLALKITKDPQMKFDLALELNELNIAKDYANDSLMWKRLARSALLKGDIELSILSLKNCNDLSTLLMIYKVQNKVDEMKELIGMAMGQGQYNVAFTAAMLTNQKDKCIEILINGKQYAEAALFARNYMPERTGECVRMWKENIRNKKVADAIANPEEYPNVFDELL
ncbi:coatomer subunit beta'-2-like [Histomonas meleagridis]|uniref:coatomer subunit beta'-2-like n=1 Tax=Histomonas meleagridis TaxID=135588 RepID=UPI0035596F2A|nr:coatomer subunit beta'-2-like [Histomonas meleagridis]KAH0806370.1 coatomer subunit beta'-2-like [Histomonas meleagridis]